MDNNQSLLNLSAFSFLKEQMNDHDQNALPQIQQPLTYEEMENLYSETLTLLNIKDNEAKKQVCENFSSLCNNIEINHPTTYQHIRLHIGIILNYWKILSEKTSSISPIEMLRSAVPILQKQINIYQANCKSMKIKELIKQRLELIMLIYAREEYNNANYNGALTIIHNRIRQSLHKKSEVNFKLRYLRSKIYQKLENTKEQLADIKACIQFLRYIQNGSDKSLFKEQTMETLKKRQIELEKINESKAKSNKQRRTFSRQSFNKTINFQQEIRNAQNMRKKSVSYGRFKYNEESKNQVKTKKNNFLIKQKKNTLKIKQKQSQHISFFNPKIISKTGKALKRESHKIGNQQSLKAALEDLPHENFSSQKDYEELLLRRPVCFDDLQKKQKGLKSKKSIQKKKQRKSVTNEEEDFEDDESYNSENAEQMLVKNGFDVQECTRKFQISLIDRFLKLQKPDDINCQQQQSQQESSLISDGQEIESVKQNYERPQKMTKRHADKAPSLYSMKTRMQNIFFPDLPLIKSLDISFKKSDLSPMPLNKSRADHRFRYNENIVENDLKITLNVVMWIEEFFCVVFKKKYIVNPGKVGKSIEEMILEYEKQINFQSNKVQNLSHQEQANSEEKNGEKETGDELKIHLSHIILSFLKNTLYFDQSQLGRKLKSKSDSLFDSSILVESKKEVEMIKIRNQRFQQYNPCLKFSEEENNEIIVEAVRDPINSGAKKSRKLLRFAYFILSKYFESNKLVFELISQYLVMSNTEKPTVQLKKHMPRLQATASEGLQEAGNGDNANKNFSITSIMEHTDKKSNKTIKLINYADEINKYFMIDSKHQERSFLIAMKHLLIRNFHQSEIFTKYFNAYEFSYLYKIEQNMCSIKMIMYQIKPTYRVGRSSKILYLFEVNEVQYKTRKMKLIGTSRDLETILGLGVGELEGNMGKNFLNYLGSFSQRLISKKHMVANRLGIRIDHPVYYLCNSFKHSHELMDDIIHCDTNYYLRHHLKSFIILYQKVIKIKSLNLFYFSVLTVVKIDGSSEVTVLLYIPETQKLWSFSIHQNILTYLSDDQICNILKMDSEKDLSKLFITNFLNNPNQQETKKMWHRLLLLLSFEKKLNPERCYIIAKVSGYWAFIKNCNVCEFVSIGKDILQIQMSLQKNSGSLNFLSKKKITKRRRITRISSNLSRTRGKASTTINYQTSIMENFSQLYESQSNNYLLYISITDITSRKKINLCYYLCQLLYIIDEIESKVCSMHNNEFREKILDCAILDRTFLMIKNYFLQEISNNLETYIPHIFNKKEPYTRLRERINLLIQHRKPDSGKTDIRQGMLKISLNTHITRVEGGNEQKTMLLYKKILIMRHHPIICILFDSNLGKLRFYICNMDSCDIKERQVDVHNHPLPFIHLLVRLGLLPVISSRIFSYHKNILLI